MQEKQIIAMIEEEMAKGNYLGAMRILLEATGKIDVDVYAEFRAKILSYINSNSTNG